MKKITLLIILVFSLNACSESNLDKERQAYIDILNISLSRDGNPSRAQYAKEGDIIIEVTNMIEIYNRYSDGSGKEQFIKDITSSAEMSKLSNEAVDNIRSNGELMKTLEDLKFNRFKLVLEINGKFYHSSILPI